MAGISGQIAEPAGNVSRYGVENASVITRHAAATVKYTRIGTVYTDTIAANSAAVLWASSPATSVVDLTTAPLVTFIVCSNGGTDTLYCCTEQTWYATVIAQQDAIPLDLVTFERIQRYQLVPISAAAIGVTGGAIEGGGAYGAFDAQSIQGGGSVSGVSISLGSGNSPPRYWTSFGFYVKVAALPGADMALCDLDLGATGYFRAKLTSAGHVVAEGSYSGCVRSLDLTPTTAVSTATWYWVAAMLGNDQAFLALNLSGRVTKIDGTGDGAQTTGYDTTGAGSGAGTYTATLGWGVHHSASYGNFPNTSGNELSKLQIATGANGPFMSYPSPVASDASPTGLVALYLCRDTTGAQTTLLDATLNHYNLSGTMTVTVDGPYP